MSTKRVLFICNTAYQLMTGVQIRQKLYPADKADLLLSNQMVGAEAVAQRARTCGLFSQVAYIENKKQTFANRIAETLHDITLIRKLRKQLGEYDVVCLSNISVFTILFLRFYQRKAFKLNIFEDGFVTYCRSFEHTDRASLIAKLINPKGILGNVSHIFLFNPDLLEWHRKNIQPVAIPKFDRTDTETIRALNHLFAFSQDDTYDKPYLFMEESFYADQFPVDDVRLVELMAEKVGRENVMVKLHPRNPENRFESRGIKTNHSFSTPWELILLNTELQDCTLVSISSSSILQPYLLLGQPIKAISLLRLLPEKPGNMKGELGVFMQSLFDKYSNICFSPATEDEFLNVLTKKSEAHKQNIRAVPEGASLA